MKIRTALSAGPDRWLAVDDDTYDGAEDSSNRHMIGYGRTEEEAIEDLKRLFREEAEWKEQEDDREAGVEEYAIRPELRGKL